MSSEWSSGLCGCFSDCSICVLSFFVPCVQVGRNAEYFGEDCTTAAVVNLCFGCPYEYMVRNRLRHLRNIRGSMTTDLMTLFFCGNCALAQDAREIKQAKMDGLTSGVVEINIHIERK